MYRRLVVSMLPIVLRKPTTIGLLNAMITPVMVLQGLFNEFRRQTSYDLSINGQVCFLQKMLNDRFDVSLRRITIEDANTFQRLYLYTRNENKPISLHTRAENKPVYLFKKEDFADTGFDFYVNLNGVTLTEQELVLMRILLNQYKLTTKTYQIR